MASLRLWEIEFIDLLLPCGQTLWFIYLFNLLILAPNGGDRQMSSERRAPARALFRPLLGCVEGRGWWEEMTSRGHDNAWDWQTAGPRRGGSSEGLLSSGMCFVGAQGVKAILPPCFLLPSPTASEMSKFEMTSPRVSAFAPVSFPKEGKWRCWNILSRTLWCEFIPQPW